ncbi:MAG: SagB family peptide dehydrogenase [Sneathiellaceae bacterium]
MAQQDVEAGEGPVRLLYRFNDDVASVAREGDRITLSIRGWKDLAFTAKAGSHADAVMALQGEGCDLAALDRIAGGDAPGAETADPARGAVRYYLERFARGRFLAWNVVDGDGLLMQVDSLASRYQPRSDGPPDSRLTLSRFACLRHRDGLPVLDSGATPARGRLTARGLQALARRLDAPAGIGDGLACALWQIGFFEPADLRESAARRTWTFHDLLMHEASRSNRDVDPVGATYRFEGSFPPPPARKPAMSGQRIDLPAVAEAIVASGSDSLHAVQSRRISGRTYAGAALPLTRLAEFLWRVARVGSVVEDPRQDLMTRPYPAGGAINELEFYVAANRCADLEVAVHHYDSHDHALVRLDGSEQVAEKISARACAAMALAADRVPPQAVISIASRLPRLGWKYENMAYRASLLHAGVVLELMYLVATDMGLAACANGTGDSRLLEAATGIDPFEETAIAEFVLGLAAD